jgi:hypothetical protein
MDSQPGADVTDPIRARRRRLLLVLILPAIVVVALGVAIYLLTNDGNSAPLVYSVF